jgi:hypothetical protein
MEIINRQSSKLIAHLFVEECAAVDHALDTNSSQQKNRLFVPERGVIGTRQVGRLKITSFMRAKESLCMQMGGYAYTREGGRQAGKYHGQGKYMHRNNGEFYEGQGQWKADKRHGQGKLTYIDGRLYEGQWKSDKHHVGRENL